MSKIREQFEVNEGELQSAPEPDLTPYEVFIQLTRGQAHVHAGTVDAANDKMALEFARKHYGRDQECVHMWVVPRDAIMGTGYDSDCLAFVPTVGRESRQRMFVDDNDASPTYGKRKRGRVYQYAFEIERLGAVAVFKGLPRDCSLSRL